MFVIHYTLQLYGKISLVPSGERIRNYAARNPATAVAKAGKFPPFLRKIFNDDPQFFCTFSVEPLMVYNYV